MIGRRGWLRAALGLPLSAHALGPPGTTAPDSDRIAPGRELSFPRDHGAHPGARTEWWYVTGTLYDAAAGSAAQAAPPTHGFQVTFFRSRTGLADTLPGRFAPRQLLFAHAALTDLAAGRHTHAQRVARWDGATPSAQARAVVGDTDVTTGRWALRREADAAGAESGGRYRTHVDTSGVEGGHILDLVLAPSQPLLLQGERGFSRKGPHIDQASHYYSQPQLIVSGRLLQPGASERPVQGRAWLDHEWSDTLLPSDAVGWDWIGINLHDGSALTAFQIRRADGSSLWTGGSWRLPGGTVRSFGGAELRWQPGRFWSSPATGARYPVEWTVVTPAGEFRVAGLLDAQELDSRAGTGSVYWEGLSALRGMDGRLLGYGYLEMTGYAGRLRF